VSLSNEVSCLDLEISNGHDNFLAVRYIIAEASVAFLAGYKDFTREQKYAREIHSETHFLNN